MPPDVPEFFIPRRDQLGAGFTLLYRPAVLGVARLHYIDKKTGTDYGRPSAFFDPLSANRRLISGPGPKSTPTKFPNCPRHLSLVHSSTPYLVRRKGQILC